MQGKSKEQRDVFN